MIKPFDISRRQILALAAFSTTAAPLINTWAQDIKPRVGTHGMVLFGGSEGLYASHMPMFHATHDVQVILHLRAENADIEKNIRHQFDAKPVLWSIEPDRFDLNRLNREHPNALTSFDAKVFEGHFERDGTVRFEKARFLVESVLCFSHLKPEKQSEQTARFIWFSQGNEHFIVKQLDRRPDIDLIGFFANEQPLPTTRTFDCAFVGLTPPKHEALLTALRSAGARPKSAVQWIYTETADLA